MRGEACAPLRSASVAKLSLLATCTNTYPPYPSFLSIFRSEIRCEIACTKKSSTSQKNAPTGTQQGAKIIQRSNFIVQAGMHDLVNIYNFFAISDKLQSSAANEDLRGKSAGRILMHTQHSHIGRAGRTQTPHATQCYAHHI